MDNLKKDITPELLDKIKKDFEKQVKKDEEIIKLLKKIDDKQATYIDANDYAIKIGKALSKSLNKNITSRTLPDGKMYYNIAERILNDRLSKNHEIITNYTNGVQSILNKKAKIGLKVIKPALNQDRIDGLVNRISSEDNFDNIKWILNEPIVNFSQSIVDDAIKENAELHYTKGLSPKIIRKEAGNCCKWCKSIVGTYSYPDVPKDVYRRHQRCRCTVDYYPGDGKKQNVHSKRIAAVKEIEDRKLLEQETDKKPYISIKKEWLKNKKIGKVEDANFWEHDGIKYFVDGKHVILDYSEKEKEVATFLSNKLGVDVKMVPRVLFPENIKTPDYLINGDKFDLKEIFGVSKSTFDNAIKNKRGQAKNFIFDISNVELNTAESVKKIEKLYMNKKRDWLKKVIIIKNENIIDIFERK